MADFQTRVDALTGLTSGTHYTTAELTEYLKDGVIEITNRCIALRPQDAEAFVRTTTSDSQGVDVGRSQIISVIREAGADGSSDGSTAWRACRKTLSSMQSRVVDIDSLHYASKYNPVYVLENNGAVNVYPVPSSNNGIKVFYINKTPVNGSGSSLIHSHDDILYFPEDKVYLVVIYAGVRCLDNALAAKGVVIESTLSPSDITLPVFPSPPTLSLQSISFSTTAPTYTTPVLSFDTKPTISDLSISASAPTIPVFSTNVISESGLTVPTFTEPVINAPDWADTNNWISTEEDSEMLEARMKEIQGKINEFSARVQNAQGKFNEENAEFQADLQIAV